MPEGKSKKWLIVNLLATFAPGPFTDPNYRDLPVFLTTNARFTAGVNG